MHNTFFPIDLIRICSGHFIFLLRAIEIEKYFPDMCQDIWLVKFVMMSVHLFLNSFFQFHRLPLVLYAVGV